MLSQRDIGWMIQGAILIEFFEIQLSMQHLQYVAYGTDVSFPLIGDIGIPVTGLFQSKFSRNHFDLLLCEHTASIAQSEVEVKTI
jgi:hypothetical protein